MRGMKQQLGNWGTISAFACRHRETKKNTGKPRMQMHIIRMSLR